MVVVAQVAEQVELVVPLEVVVLLELVVLLLVVEALVVLLDVVLLGMLPLAPLCCCLASTGVRSTKEVPMLKEWRAAPPMTCTSLSTRCRELRASSAPASAA